MTTCPTPKPQPWRPGIGRPVRPPKPPDRLHAAENPTYSYLVQASVGGMTPHTSSSSGLFSDDHCRLSVPFHRACSCSANNASYVRVPVGGRYTTTATQSSPVSGGSQGAAA